MNTTWPDCTLLNNVCIQPRHIFQWQLGGVPQQAQTFVFWNTLHGNTRIENSNQTCDNWQNANMDEHNNSMPNTIPITKLLKLRTHKKHVYGFKTWANKKWFCWILHMNNGKSKTTIQTTTTTNSKYANIDDPCISRFDTISKTKILRMKTNHWKRMLATQFQNTETWRPNQIEPTPLALQTHDAWIPNIC